MTPFDIRNFPKTRRFRVTPMKLSGLAVVSTQEILAQSARAVLGPNGLILVLSRGIPIMVVGSQGWAMIESLDGMYQYDEKRLA